MLLHFDEAYDRYQQERTSHWDQVAKKLENWQSWGKYYHKRLNQIYQFLVPSGQRVLEIGCAGGDLLASLNPAYGVGVDFSSQMLDHARQQYPQLHFIQGDAHEFNLDEKFDTIILSDVVNDFWDVQTVFEKIRPLCLPSTRIY